MDNPTIRKFRENIRHIERELNIQNNSNCSPDISLPQCHMLLELNSQGKSSINELSKRLHLDKSTVSRTVDTLVRDKYASRIIPEENRRKVTVSLTPKGKVNCDRINKDNDAYFGIILDAVPAKDQAVFLRSFERVVKKMIECNHKHPDHC